jgi:hypothetical protein
MPQLDTNTLLASPIADFASAIAEGIATAQKSLDENSLALWKQVETDPNLQSLKDVGYRPNWYVIPSAEAEVKLFFHFESDETTSKGGRMFVLPFNAATQARTSLQQEGSSRLTLKIVPMPPPSGLTGS